MQPWVLGPGGSLSMVSKGLMVSQFLSCSNRNVTFHDQALHMKHLPTGDLGMLKVFGMHLTRTGLLRADSHFQLYRHEPLQIHRLLMTRQTGVLQVLRSTDPAQTLSTSDLAFVCMLYGQDMLQASDVFSLGVLIFEMLTGKLAWCGMNPSQVHASPVAPNAPC